MKRPSLIGVLTLLLLAGTAQAWQPSGWSFWSWPYAYDQSSGDWYWFNTSDTQWAYGYPPANGWKKLAESALAQGWSYHAWPYAYDSDSGAWFYFNEADVQWCVNMRTRAWSRFGQAAAPAGMVLIPAGSFSMGDSFSEGFSDELPVHTVYVSAFYMDKFEVTKALWDEVRAWGLNNGYTDLPAGGGKASNHPVQTVSWYDVVKWCNARSQKEGRPACYTVGGNVYKTGQSTPDCNWSVAGYRLPTEAEWEKAARGGASGRRFPWSDSDNTQHTRANYYSSSSISYDTSATKGYHPDYDDGGDPYTSPVGSFAPNGYGLYDMAGNVWEWCWDWSGSGYYGTSPGSDPRGATSGSFRMDRGGSWGFHAGLCRVADRHGFNPVNLHNALGFRAVRPPGQ